MPKVSVDVQSWSRFLTSELSIVPSIAGAVHRFPCQGKIVEIFMPKRPPKVSPGAGFDEHASIVCQRWWSKSGRPVSFTVRSVDVVVTLKRTVKLNPVALEHVDVGLFSDAARRRLDNLVDQGKHTASAAFDRWDPPT